MPDNTKIKNIVFDVGRVLVDFYPERYLRSLGLDKETADRLMTTVFGVDWSMFDRGDYYSLDELRKTLIRKHPEDEAVLRRVLTADVLKIHTLMPESANYLLELKARGYKVYLLSNIARDSYHFVKEYPFFNKIDGGVFSYRERVCKPDEGIYRVLLGRYGLDPAETLFFDDNPKNVDAAQKLGIRSILFTDITDSKRQAEMLLADSDNDKGE
ncbi:MAG: HAD family phosphatase [Oscillospiraceae bacterium]|nr:HAD family phosphatase [Oscillospiraceae bacterium]